MALEKRREDARRVDVFCCVKSSAPVDQGCCFGACGTGKPRERLSTKVMRGVAHVLSRNWCRVIVIIVWLGVLAAGIYGTSQMKVDADVNDFIPEGSYLKGWLRTQEKYFKTAGTQVSLYWVSTDEVCSMYGALCPCAGRACAGGSLHNI
jgi:Niemann-Pick C1 protein